MMYGTDKYEGKTYATRSNARFYPVCVGERALQCGTHFHFCTTN